MRYRQECFQPDTELIAMIDALRRRVCGDELTFILNGDIFDFDLPCVENGFSYLPNAERTARISVPILTNILRDHSAFMHALGRLLADGHRIVFITGNHDAEMTLPEVRNVLRETLLGAAADEGASRNDPTIVSRIIFRGWFYLDQDRMLFEHGHQYAELNCQRLIMHPYAQNSNNIAPTFGSLVSRFFGTRMGYFNPNVDSSYLLSAYGYFRHWMRYYLFSSHEFYRTIARGMTNTVVELLSQRTSETFVQRRQNQELAIQETGVSKRKIVKHLAACIPPIDTDFRRVIRRLGLDHAAALTFATICGVAWIHFTHGKLMYGAAALAPTIYFGYALALPRKVELDETWSTVQQKTKTVASIYDATAVVFGHTHHPVGQWENGVFYGNSGSWAAAFFDVECTKPVSSKHPLIWLTRKDSNARVTGGLFYWKDGSFISPSVTTSTQS
jgi:UDP-2,3-diacylglucosamine pyrophosphatase LpxH